jgi:hypothetical protein
LASTLSKDKKTKPGQADLKGPYAALPAGADGWLIAENAYFQHLEGVATAAGAGMAGKALGKEPKLKPHRKVVLTRSAGYPKKQVTAAVQ